MIARYDLEKMGFYILIVLSFFVMLILNVLTPLLADDFTLSHPFSIMDAFRATVNFYMKWVGRSVGIFIVTIFLMLPKEIFNLFNSLAYIWLTILIYIFAHSDKKYNITLYMFIHFTIWLYVALYGQVILWISAAGQYLWGATIILSFLLPYHMGFVRKVNINDNIFIISAMFIFGLMAGWCNYNTSGGCILMVILFLIYGKKQKFSLQRWMISGLLGNLIGFCFMVLAPGNFARSQHYAISPSLISNFVFRFQTITNFLQENLTHLLIIFIILIIIQIVKNNDWRRTYISFSYFLVSMITLYALILSPTNHTGRPTFGATIFLILSCSHCFANISRKTDNSKVIITSFISILCLYFIFSFITGFIDIARIKAKFDARMTYIEHQKNNGNLDIIVPFITPRPKTKYVAFYGLADLRSEPSVWYNNDFSKMYGLKSIKAIPIDEWTEWKKSYDNREP